MHKDNFKVHFTWRRRWWWWFILVKWSTNKGAFSLIQGQNHYWRFLPLKISTYSEVTQVLHCTTQWASAINIVPDLTASLKTPFNQSLSQRLTVKNFLTDSRNLAPKLNHVSWMLFILTNKGNYKNVCCNLYWIFQLPSCII